MRSLWSCTSISEKTAEASAHGHTEACVGGGLTRALVAAVAALVKVGVTSLPQ